MRRGRHVLDLPVSLPSIVSLCESCALCRFLTFAGHTRARAPLTRVIMRSFARLFVVALAGTRVADTKFVRGTVDTIQAWKYITRLTPSATEWVGDLQELDTAQRYRSHRDRQSP